jgi:hypothetical protein
VEEVKAIVADEMNRWAIRASSRSMSRCSKNPHDEQKIDCELNRQKRAESSTMLARVMGGEIPGNANGIARSLDEGWHYRPDWRSATVEAYLVDKQMEQPPLETLKEEEDCFVRQFYLFRRCGRCLEQFAFKWAYACVVNNPATAAASLVKALTVANEKHFIARVISVWSQATRVRAL